MYDMLQIQVITVLFPSFVIYSWTDFSLTCWFLLNLDLMNLAKFSLRPEREMGRCKGHEGTFWLGVVVATQIYTSVKSHQTVHLRSVHFVYLYILLSKLIFLEWRKTEAKRRSWQNITLFKRESCIIYEVALDLLLPLMLLRVFSV